MATLLKRQLTDQEKEQVLQRHGRVCFANGHTIPESETVHYDHILAHALEGNSEIDNIAPMCSLHNQQKGQLPLFDFRTKLRLMEFFEGGDKQTLKHLLQYLKDHSEIEDFGRRLSIKEDRDQVELQAPDSTSAYSIYTCPTTSWKYFYAILPTQLINSDDDENGEVGLQPRYLIFDKVFALFRHFQQHPVLQPSVGRVVGDQIKLFDGQHKVAALLLNGRQMFECKIYLDPDMRLLNQTNIAAHDKFAQTRFFSSIMVQKLGTQFGADFEGYKNLEDGNVKSESGFMSWLRAKEGGTLTNAQLNERFRSFLYNVVLEDPGNKLSRLVSASNRSSVEKPLTIDLLSKSIFSNFLFRHPLSTDLTSENYKREVEVKNVVWLMTTMDELGLSQWDGKAPASNDHQRKLNRIVRSKSMMAWSEILADAIRATLDIVDSDDKLRAFQRDLTDDQKQRVKRVVERLMNWVLWSSPSDSEIDRILADNKNAVKNWFKDKGLTAGYLMGASS